MSGVLATVGKVAGVVATVAAVIPGAQPIAAIAAAVALVANVGSSVLAKPPPARGSVNGITIGTDQPSPYMIGRTYYGGSRQQQVGYGPTIDKVPNPYALIVDLYSAAGPIGGYEGFYADFAAVPMAGGAATGYARGLLWTTSQLGLVPEPSALASHFAGAPGWGPDYKLSGKAAVAWSLLFDRKGVVFASGVPQFGVVARGVRVYDPRKDSTYPGGSGAHRITDETTWEWSENPGLHALTYAYGRYQRGTKVFGVGIPLDGLIVDHFVAHANVCDANGWKVGGVIFEPGNKWTNLKDILAAGGAEPCFVGGRLGLRISAPRIALDTITMDDLADGEISVGAMQGWETRLNTLIPKYRSEPHKWEYVQSTAPVTIAAYVAQDGETKQEERQFNLVQDKDQAAQLCAYELLDRRELGDIELRLKPRLRRYGGGDLLIVDLPEAGLVAQPCVVMKRTLDPLTMTVTLVLRGETSTKHAFALGRTGTAPPTPTILSAADRDSQAAPVAAEHAVYELIEQNEAFPVTPADTSVTIAAFTAVVKDGLGIMSFPAGQVAGLESGREHVVLYARVDHEEPLLAPGGTALLAPDGTAFTTLIEAGTYVVLPSPAMTSMASSDFILIRRVTTLVGGAVPPPTVTPPAGDGGNGSGGGGNCVTADSLILMADGSWKRADQLARGDPVRTRHEVTLAWDDFTVSAVRVVREPIMSAAGYPTATAAHRFWTETDGWFRMDQIGEPAGFDDVVRITVAGAHTYVARHPDASVGVLSHNIKQATDAGAATT